MKVQNWQPHKYQINAAQHALYNAGAALFLEPGLGKTAISLAVCKVLAKEKLIAGTLVVAPLRVCYSVWPREVAKWADFKGMSVGILHGPRKASVLAEKHDVYVINPEGLTWLAGALGKRDVWPFDNLILDESTKFKHTGTQRFKTLKLMLPKFKRRLLLTGTPAANNIADLFGQVFVIDNGARLGKFITHFRREFFDEHRHYMGFSEWMPRKDTAERIKNRIQDVCLYMSAEDHLSMPKRIDNRIEVELPEAVRSIYNRVERDYFVELDKGSVNAAHAAAVQMKLRQVVGGAVYTDNGVEALHDAKLDALEDLIEEASGQPVLVAVNFKHEAERIQKMLKAKFNLDAPYLGGGISAAKSDAIAYEWNEGKLPVLLAHPTSVAHGLNLQAGGHTVVWFTLTWSLEEYDQFNRRVYRQGQQNAVIIHHIIAANTVDEDVYEALQSKDRNQRGLLEHLKKRKAA